MKERGREREEGEREGEREREKGEGGRDLHVGAKYLHRERRSTAEQRFVHSEPLIRPH
jgi:hypothetical protein